MDALTTQVPAGYAMPPEWAPHRRCWMAWPCNAACFDQHLAEAKAAFAEVARTIARFEPVVMIARPSDAQEAERACGDEVEVRPLDLDDSWTRDIGPLFLTGPNGLVATSFEFNGWGGVWADFEYDARVAGAIADWVGCPRYEIPMVFEGGAVHTDGAGMALSTRSCIRHRNPLISKADADRFLCAATGCETIVWLPGDEEEVETRGHVDLYAAFAAPGVVLAAVVEDETDPTFEVLDTHRQILSRRRAADGTTLEVIPFPYLPAADLPPRTCRSYVNFYLANGAVILPAYGHELDDVAARRAEQVFPDREVVPVRVEAIARGGGAIHCATLQEPEVGAS